jgi:hypothetical protein
MSISVGNGMYMSCDYNGMNRVVKLAKDYNEGDAHLELIDMTDGSQFKKFLVEKVQNPTLLKEIKERIPRWMANNLRADLLPGDTVLSFTQDLPNDLDTVELVRLQNSNPFPLVAQKPAIVHNPNRPGVILKNGNMRAELQISNRHDYGTGVSEYVLRLDGTIYSCPVAFIAAIKAKLGL